MNDLVNELSRRIKTLEITVNQLGKSGREHANAEAAYRTALAKAILLRRDEGMPVTIIGDVCRGSAEIAQLKLKRDIAEVNHQVCLESINSQKLAIRILDAQLQREWVYDRKN